MKIERGYVEDTLEVQSESEQECVSVSVCVKGEMEGSTVCFRDLAKLNLPMVVRF
jgi:hypothetical protein